LSKQQKQDYKNNVYKNSNFLTDNSYISIDEHFAEYFSLYCQNPDWFLDNKFITEQEKKYFRKIKV